MTSSRPATADWTLHPHRALPAEPGLRDIAVRIYEQTASLPLVCMHGHVEASVFADDEPFADPAQLLIVPDHYVTRMMASQGIPLESLGVPRRDGGPVETDSRKIFRTFCENWHLYRGTPSRYWLEHELVEVFGVTERPSAESADRLYDRISECVADPSFRPRALLDRFNIEIISTTDPASSDLSVHGRIAEDGLGERVVPTFRPDGVLQLERPTWREEIATLAEVSGIDTSSYAGYLDALRERRAAFVAAGARATDHGHLYADTHPMDPADAASLYSRVLGGETPTAAEARAFSAHMLLEMAGMSCEDGLVMQIHPGVLRDHSTQVFERHGQDKGYDIPIGAEYARAVRPMLERHGLDPRFRVILFTIDETVYSRELAPLAGAYPSVRLGAPWWFLDSPDGMRRFRELVTETAGFANMSGFVDDTRAYASIPARHDLARRVDAGYLARLVAEHRLEEDEAIETAVDLAYRLPRLSYPKPVPA
ncbi:glucuronate isomerase [Brachybacterium phenoliresistens]|uniref:Uronate isomerase n=1 Tax=Brachybacterium phenoliresistens TaxID=396014 RepID=Z9JUQ9_9MICO|nr:glucuronate isomerase [Brachybacterium phenoliresistens]EWS82095.1 glucuronate isomerase [Brachybacterium phenoliresistens]